MVSAIYGPLVTRHSQANEINITSIWFMPNPHRQSFIARHLLALFSILIAYYQPMVIN